MNDVTIKEIFKPYSEGSAVALLTGRPIYDLECSSNMETTTTLVAGICNYAYQHYGMAMVRYSLAFGIGINEKAYSAEDNKRIKETLAALRIMDSDGKSSQGKCEAGQELIDILKGFLRLAEPKFINIKWSDGRPLRFMLILEFSSDILPESTSINQLIASEVAYISAHSVIIRDTGNYVLMSDVIEGKVDTKIRNILPSIVIGFPGYEDKLKFINVLHRRYPSSKYEDGLNDQQAANLTSNTPNRGLEAMFLGSHKNGTKITAAQLIEQKVKDVSAISEGTLTLLDTLRIKDVDLVGSTIEVPKKFLSECALGLRQKNKLTPLNILLLGAPSTGKTDLALMVASIANVPAYSLNSPKAGIVGESERKARLQMNVFKSMSPNLGFVDEISEAFPMERSNTNLDSGASAAVTAALLESLSDKTREGNSILVATSNCGWKIGGAMLSRFTVVPVLMPVSDDFPKIISSLVKSISPGTSIDISEQRVVQAAQVFYEKNLMPRQIRGALKYTMSLRNSLTPEDILWAAFDAAPADYISRVSSIYSDYYALRLCFSKSLLPWSGKSNFPFPEYIEKILDGNMEIDVEKLNEEMDKLKPYVNV